MLGVLSLIFWSLIIVITLKYVTFILRADNHGEGGILALTALATPVRRIAMSRQRWLVLSGLFGAALIYGDGVITPAISVLSAVEGLNVVTPFFRPYVLPITVVILIILFMIQRHGTARIGGLFGPIMVVWFAVLAVLGIIHIVQAPQVLAAINPVYGANFFVYNGWHGFLVLGTVFLVVTGGEALYADMGHFGPKPIRLAWFVYVLPALLLNYFGQGSLVLRHPEAAANSFYMMVPSWALLPLVRARYGCYHHCVTGADFWRLLAHDAGRASRFPASAADQPHVRDGFRSNLHPYRQLGAHDWLHRHRAWLPNIQQSCGGVRRRRDLDDGDHDDHLWRRGA